MKTGIVVEAGIDAKLKTTPDMLLGAGLPLAETAQAFKGPVPTPRKYQIRERRSSEGRARP